MGTDADGSLNKPSVVVSRPLTVAVDIMVNATPCVYCRGASPELFPLELLSTEEIVPMKAVDNIISRVWDYSLQD